MQNNQDDSKIQNNQEDTYLKDLTDGNEERHILAFALSNKTIKNVTPSNWKDAFKNLLTEKGGAVVIVSKDHRSDSVNAALQTYGKWWSENFTNVMEPEEEENTWIYYSGDNGELHESSNFQTLVKGNLLIMSGGFPTIKPIIPSVGERPITSGFKFPLLMIKTLNVLLLNVFNSISLIEKDIKDNINKTNKYVLINPSLLDWYMDSRKTYLSGLSSALFHCRGTLNGLMSHVQRFERDNNPNQMIYLMEKNIDRKENDLAQLMIDLKEMKGTLADNGKEFLKAMMWLVVGIFSAVSVLVRGIEQFVNDKEDKLKKDRFISGCVWGGVFMFFLILIVAVLGRWKVKVGLKFQKIFDIMRHNKSPLEK